MSMIDRTHGVRIGIAGTPIPRRDLTVNGPSEVREYKLSPEELAEIRSKYPPTKQDKNFTKPIEIKPKPKKEEAVMPRGRKPKNAEQQPVLREKEATVQKPVNLDLLDKAEKEIERLTAELAESKAANDSQSAIIERMKKDLESSGKEASNLRASLEARYKYTDELTSKIGWLRAELEKAKTENDSLKKDLEDMIDTLAAPTIPDPKLTVAEPPSDVQILDTAIADLTRARWILNRLSASGE